MALSSKSLFLYNFQITALNASIDFKPSSISPVLYATLTYGFYSLTGLATEIERALGEADANNTYTVSVNRNVAGGLQNRVTISTSGSYLSLLFSSGSRSASSVASTIGFNVADYTGALTYTGNTSAGTVMIPTMIGYNYLSPDYSHKVFGQVNVSASGVKEAIVYNVQKFLQVQFRYEPKLAVITSWLPFMDWAIQQRPFEFTPEISDPNTFYNVTLESTSADGKGLGYTFSEMLPDFPNIYDIGSIKMRKTE
jgi:hypothetical protein